MVCRANRRANHFRLYSSHKCRATEKETEMSKFLHYGRPAANVGCAHSDGTPMWDAEAARAEAWADAQAAVAGYAPATRKFLFACADRAQEQSSSAGMDRLESRLLGEPVTAGTFPKRQRFWRFVILISRGITPRDLREIDTGNKL